MSITQVFAEIEALHSAGVVEQYALGGAVGATYYVGPATTEDVDIFVVFRPGVGSALAPLTPVYEFLEGRSRTPTSPAVSPFPWRWRPIYMKHDPMLDEAGLLSDPYDAEDDCDTEDHGEMELICEGWDVEVDRDVETITMYLWGGLTRNQSIATYHRLVRDRRFREKAHPYIEVAV